MFKTLKKLNNYTILENKHFTYNFLLNVFKFISELYCIYFRIKKCIIHYQDKSKFIS